VRDRCLAPLNTLEAELKANQPLWLGPSSKAPIAAINLTVQLAFMVKPKLKPDEDQAIATAVKDLFPPSTASDRGGRIDHHFSKQALQKAGFKIVRTSYLSEHLLLDETNRTVWLFTHADFLKSCQNHAAR
jgi:hypothetical protein